MVCQIHPSVFIDRGADIGSKTKIWHFSHICSGAVIGKNCNIGQNVYVGPDVIIKDNCKIQNNVSIYKGVTLYEDVFVGPSVTFTNILCPRAFIDKKDKFSNTIVKKGATIGANSTIICGITIGSYSFIGAGSVVTKSIGDFELVYGVPARFIKHINKEATNVGF